MSYNEPDMGMASPSSQATEESLVAERKRDIVVLIMRFLYDYGFVSSYQSLCNEVSFSLNQIDAADNVDLWSIIQEYVDFYHIRFARYPKLVRQPYSADYSAPLGGSGSMLPASLSPPASALQQPTSSTAILMPSLLAASQSQQPFGHAGGMSHHNGGANGGTRNEATGGGRYDFGATPMSHQLGRGETTSVMQHVDKYGQYSSGGGQLGRAGDIMSHASQRTSNGGGISGGGGLIGGLHGQQHSHSHIQRGSQQQQSSSSPMQDGDSDGGNVFVAFTTRLGCGERITQEDFCDILTTAPLMTPSQLLGFTRPKRTHSKRRSSNLALSDAQEEALYALVGCTGVGWLIKNISKPTKEFLQRRFGIDKDLLQLFFKNRAQKAKRRRTTGGSSRGGTGSVSGHVRGSLSGGDADFDDASDMHVKLEHAGGIGMGDDDEFE